MTHDAHIKAAEDYLGLIEMVILKTGKATVPASVLADAGTLHAALAVAKVVMQETEKPRPHLNAAETRTGPYAHRQHGRR